MNLIQLYKLLNVENKQYNSMSADIGLQDILQIESLHFN